MNSLYTLDEYFNRKLPKDLGSLSIYFTVLQNFRILKNFINQFMNCSKICFIVN